MKKDIICFCTSCDICQKIKLPNFSRYGLLMPQPIPSHPYESVSLDLVAGLPWSNDFNAILVIVNRMTKHSQFIPTTTGLSAEGFANLFVRHVACRFGIPDTIISDRDPRWTSDFWKAISKCLHTRMSLSSSHHPQHDGQMEIINKKVEIMLRAYVAADKTSWSDWLHLLEHAYNQTVHASTGFSPHFLLYGFQPKDTLDFLSPLCGGHSPQVALLRKNEQAYMDLMRFHRDSARQAIAESQVKQSDAYNKGRRLLQFKVGDLVLVNPHLLEWLESKGEGSKLVQRAIGPFAIQERVNPKVYRLDMSDKYSGSPVFNNEHLRPYHASDESFGPRDTLPDTRPHLEALPEYQVERIVGHKYDRRKCQMTYLVQWEGYSPLYDEWLMAKDLRNALQRLRSYRQEHDLTA
ncbi:hypothetical protein EWM64_g8836 [Hericium alpestre]|uniref:Integrase catalytic domain-containing protein n=1 Tax=Hericium alpestre TaxID=135208 RepID=A0A4Y9ZMH1_9AGAM|nr:hypothetical protein EWM64_g8836 [Hericium alpestre]